MSWVCEFMYIIEVFYVHDPSQSHDIWGHGELARPVHVLVWATDLQPIPTFEWLL